MTCWPVILRELRAESRRPMNYWIRILGAGAITLVFGVSMLSQSESPATLGARLFGNLNATLFAAIWILVPLLTADCISQEKREGTLGLLFMTQLTASGIVFGKSLIHGLRSLTLLLGMLPILSLPFLLGGVSWKDGLLALMLDLSALILALAAGLLASTLVKDRVRALALALMISFVFAGIFMFVHWIGYWWLIAQTRSTFGFSLKFTFGQMLSSLFGQDMVSQAAGIFCLNTNLATRRFFFFGYGNQSGFWNQTWASFPVPLHYAWLRFAAGLLGLACLAYLGIMHLAARQVRRAWRLVPLSARQQWLLDFFCTPRIWNRLFRTRRARRLAQNPIGWLQQYSWGNRLNKWGWCLLIVIAECVLVGDSQLTLLWVGQYALAQLLILSLAFTASGSFREEQESGALELLLVTPLNEQQIISGRIRGIWNQFLPAALVLSLSWLFLFRDLKVFGGYRYGHEDTWRVLVFPLFFITSYLTLPFVGLYFSLRRMNFIAAWLLTCLTGLFVPFLIYGVLFRTAGISQSVFAMLGAQLAGAMAAWFLLNRQLGSRVFGVLRSDSRN